MRMTRGIWAVVCLAALLAAIPGCRASAMTLSGDCPKGTADLILLDDTAVPDGPAATATTPRDFVLADDSTAAPTARPTPDPTPEPTPTPTACPTATKKPVVNKTPAPARTTPCPATATPAPAVTATKAPPPTNLSVESGKAQYMLQLVNEARAEAKLPPLVWDSTLAAGALKHAKDMAEHGFFSHTSPTYGDFSTRFAASGASGSPRGENLAMVFGFDGTTSEAFRQFMASEGHRNNILKKDYTRIGIAVVYNGVDRCYFAQWFAG